MFEKILVPLDTSSLAEQVLPPVLEIARAFNSTIDLLTVCEPHKIPEVETCQSYLDEQAGKLKSSLEGSRSIINPRVVTGSPEHSILEHIKSENTNLVFLSSHGRTGIMPWPLGSTVDRVLRRTEVPLIIVKAIENSEESPSAGLFNRIMVTLDGSERGAVVLPYVAGISEKLHPEVILIHVVDTDRKVHNLGRVDTVPFIEQELETIKKRAEDYLEQQSRKFSDARTVSRVIRTGNVALEIMKHAAETDTSLIAMSSHGHSGLESWFIGSITHKILHAGGKSLLFVPAWETR